MKTYPISAVSEYRKNIAGRVMALSILMAGTANALVIEGIEFERELALNGQKPGTIEGGDFDRSVFSIWIGAQPIDHDFKETIQGAR